ncbi:MAG: BON domain-containing protein [Oligoflexus sp.]|nr:BON domain-containing protein [Oligoflexus sp.]
MGDKAASPTEEPSRTVNPSAVVGTEADNSKVNRLSDGDKGLSADQQGNSKSDVEMTRKIRRSITSNKNLSTYAHNIKIITRGGRVVLKGPVRSEAERKIVEDTAVTVAGIENVTSGLEVKAK